MNVKKAIATIAAALAVGGGAVETALQNEPVDIVFPNEIVELRTANSRVIRQGERTRKAEIFSIPKFYKDDEGKFKWIDTDIKRKPPIGALLSRYKYEVTAGLYYAEFDSAKIGAYKLIVENDWIEFDTEFVENDDLQVILETTTSGVKETVVLKNEKAPARLKWLISSNAKKTGYNFGRITVKIPIVIDSQGNIIPADISMTDDSLVIVVDTNNAKYPIEIDPSTSVSATIASSGTPYSAQSANFDSIRAATTALGTDAQIGVGQYVEYRIYRGFATYDLSGTAVAGAVDSARIKAYANVLAGSVDFYLCKATCTGSLSTAWYNDFEGWAPGNDTYSITAWSDEISSADITASAWNYLQLNVAGETAIKNAMGSTEIRICFIDDADRTNTEVGGNNRLFFDDDPNTSELEIWYIVGWTGKIAGVDGPNKVAGVSYTDIAKVAGVE